MSGGPDARDAVLMWLRLLPLLLACCGARTELDFGDGGPAPRVLQVSAGRHTTCALREGGLVTCWGRRLGAPVEQLDLEPTDLFRVPGAVQLDIGGGVGCVRLDTGEVRCWGSNCLGRLGRADVLDTTEPLEVPDIDDAIDVSVGISHACVVRRSGEVWCWGSNNHGQLGDGTEAWLRDDLVCDTHVRVVGRAEPGPVAGLRDATQVSAGVEGTCARTSLGEVWCWGDNRYSQVGDGTTTDRASPARVEGVARAVQVAFGFASCALDEHGAVACWGDNECLQIGPEHGASTPAPALIVGLESVVQIDVDEDNVCAVDRGGGALCWGCNGSGAAGSPAPEDDPTRWPPGRVYDAGLARQVAVGWGWGCLLERMGRVACWGTGGFGQLGTGRGGDDSGYKSFVALTAISAP